jgi:hypothetical protein
MKIVLKPGGLAIVAAMIMGLCAIAYYGPRRGAPPNSGSLPANSRNLSAWKVSDGKDTIERMTVGMEDRIFEIPATVVKSPPANQGVFSVLVRFIAKGKDAKFPKYGIRVQSADSFREVWIDSPNHVLATFGGIGNANRDWRNSPLPPGFDDAQEHELKIAWRDGGKVWRYTLDNNDANAQEESLPIGMIPSSVCLVTEDMRASYRKITVR